METVIVCQAAEGFPVHFDKQAFGADHIVASRSAPAMGIASQDGRLRVS